MGIKIKGVKECIKHFDNTINDLTKNKAVRAMHASIIVGASQAALYTPIDTSTLLNSQSREITINGTRITGRVGYSANYTTYVHDSNYPMKFKRASAKKEFLYKGFKDSEALILNIIKKELFS